MTKKRLRLERLAQGQVLKARKNIEAGEPSRFDRMVGFIEEEKF